jgi:aminoglycoside 3-N-acetyltransferase
VTVNGSTAYAGMREGSVVSGPVWAEWTDPVPQRDAVLSSQEIADDLRTLGVTPGQTLLVHASLRSIGWVDGGAESVVRALLDVLGPSGTLVVPTSTAENSDSSRAHLARIAGMTEQETARFRAEMRPFDRGTTPSTGVGLIAEAVRINPKAIRSDHPQSSFAALGPKAAELMAGHELDCHLGDDSPLGKMYCLDASVLLLGVSFSACTALHLAEYWYTLHPPTRTYSCVIASGSGGAWVTYKDVVLDDSDFKTLGVFLDQSEIPDYGRVGNADCRLMPLCKVVDVAAEWMQEHRSDPRA